MVNNELKGTANDVVGKVKDASGGLTGDLGLQADGKLDQVKGFVQKEYGDTIDQVKDGAKAASDAASDASRKARDGFEQAKGHASRIADDVADQSTDFTRRAAQYGESAVKSQPVLVVAGAALLGYLAGLLIHGRR